jgi:hypothetical protein
MMKRRIDKFWYKVKHVSREGREQEFYIWETVIDLFEKVGTETWKGQTYNIKTGEFLY